MNVIRWTKKFSTLPAILPSPLWVSIIVDVEYNLNFFPWFVWEDSHHSGTPNNKPRLVALTENYELLIYEFNLEDGRCDATVLCSCSEDIAEACWRSKYQ